MELSSFNINEAVDFNTENGFDSEILIKSSIDFDSNKQKYNKKKPVNKII